MKLEMGAKTFKNSLKITKKVKESQFIVWQKNEIDVSFQKMNYKTNNKYPGKQLQTQVHFLKILSTNHWSKNSIFRNLKLKYNSLDKLF